ncbi:MAG TPA: hypothetical protein VLF68_04685 [Candidatus Saccharimonadales bacterium]|nr:hypothetical protein [Candidatus Saccharimonadales bacterium]
MGKIRVKTLGIEEEEKKQQQEQKKKREIKKAEKKSEVVSADKTAGGTADDLRVAREETGLSAEASAKVEPAAKEEKTKTKKDKFKKQTAPRSKSYQLRVAMVDRTKTYNLKDALELLEKLKGAKFDETVELHINTITPGISGNLTLPHGTGKKTRVAIATDALLAEVAKGIISFDILVAEPSMMPKLARVAKVLGPRGLMPNPKNGTITPKPQDVVKKYEAGQINFKTEAKAPIMHVVVGKLSFGPQKLSQNIEAMLSAVKKHNIQNVTLKSTMSPGIKISVS